MRRYLEAKAYGGHRIENCSPWRRAITKKNKVQVTQAKQSGMNEEDLDDVKIIYKRIYIKGSVVVPV